MDLFQMNSAAGEIQSLSGFAGEFSHICVIVKDIRNAMEKYQRFLGVEAPRLKKTCEPEVAKVEYLEKPTDAVAWQTFFTIGSVRVELIEPDEHPSTWKSFLEEHGEGFHHISYVVKDLEKELERFREAGMGVCQRGNYNGGRYAYLDTENEIGIMLELRQND